MSDPADHRVDAEAVPPSPEVPAQDAVHKPKRAALEETLPAPTSSRRRLPTAARVLLGIGVLGLVVLVVIWALGGFAPRSDSDRVEPGEQFSVGPMTLSFERVILMDAETSPTWWVTGTCRWDLPSWSPVTSGIGRAALLGVRDPLTDEVTINQTPGTIEFDRYPDTRIGDREALSPDMDAIDCMIRYTMPPDTPVSADRATLLIYDLIWSEARNTSSDDDSSKTWVPGGTAHRVDLPVMVHEG